MTHSLSLPTLLALAVAPLIGLSYWVGQEQTTDPHANLQTTEIDRELQYTRQQVLMLDDLYKNAVVLITKHYVHQPTDLSAATACKALFAAMKQKGHHEVRLLDATGSPYNDENLANDSFEKKAIDSIKQGSQSFEEVEKRQDGRYLRFATAVPVVMDKCVMCHESYKDVKQGEAIGALTYTVKIPAR